MGIHNDTDSNALEGEPVNVKRKKDKAKLIFKLLNYLGLKVVCFLFNYKNEITRTIRT